MSVVSMKPFDTVEVLADCQDSRGRTFTAGQRGQVVERQGSAVLIEFEGYAEERELARLHKEESEEGIAIVCWAGWLRVEDLVVRESGQGSDFGAHEHEATSTESDSSPS